MTCIVGLQHKGKVWIGGDSLGVGEDIKQQRADPKVFHRGGEFLFGYTSSYRMGSLLRFTFDPPPCQGKDHERYMNTAFIESLRECFKTHGYMSKEAEAERGGRFLAGFRGTLYTIDTDFQVGTYMDGYGSVGCGEKFALGSLCSTPKVAPRKRVLTALEAAAKFSTGVGGPFVVLSV